VIKQTIMVAGILTAIFITGYLVSLVFPISESIQVFGFDREAGLTDTARVLYPSPFLILFMLFITTQVAGVLLKLNKQGGSNN
jgi:4-hydroxybenzoate polyprenyltransferase